MGFLTVTRREGEMIRLVIPTEIQSVCIHISMGNRYLIKLVGSESGLGTTIRAFLIKIVNKFVGGAALRVMAFGSALSRHLCRHLAMST